MRTIMSFATQGAGVTLSLDRAPANIAGQGESVLVTITGVPAAGTQTIGASLAAVLNGHPRVKSALESALSAVIGSPPSPLYFDTRTPLADALLWEALYVGPPVGFCALDQRWPVGRIATTRRELDVRLFVPPLRIVAVLAANGREGRPQFAAILAAVTADRPSGAVPAVLHVIASEDAVIDAATAAAANGAPVTVERIAGTQPDVARQITDAQPHILHVLSHGGLFGAVWSLFLATAADDHPGADPQQRGSVPLPAAELARALQPVNPWLVVLGACATADATANGPALANELASAGVPTVVGMRRLVDLRAMNQFCKALYPQVLELVDKTLVQGRGAPLDWVAALTGPRSVLGAPDPNECDTWTDPVLYAQHQTLQVVMTGSPAAADTRGGDVRPTSAVIDLAARRGELAQWQSFLVNLDPETPSAVHSEVRAKIAALESALPGGAS